MESIEEQIEQQIYAAEMAPDRIYFTVQSNIKVKLRSKGDGYVELNAFSPATGEWRAVKVNETYAVRPPRKEEITMTEATVPATAETSKVKAEPKNKGKVSGLKMLAAWGHYFEKFGAQENGRQLIIDAMSADFPHKVDSILRWVDSYKGYYNTGRLPGVAKPEVKLVWATPEDAAKAEIRAAAAAAKAEKKAAKEAEKATKAEEKAAKKAAKEAARAEAAAVKAAEKAAAEHPIGVK
jgi:hypothetical protein